MKPFKHEIQKKKWDKLRKIIWLRTLIPILLVVIALSILLGCLFGCKENTTFILKNENSVTQYLKKHKSVHKGEQHFNGSNLTHENRQYIYDNFNGQNMLNGLIAWNFYGSNEVWHWDSLYGSKWEIKHGKNWASIKALDNNYDKSDLPDYISYANRYVRVSLDEDGNISVISRWKCAVGDGMSEKASIWAASTIEYNLWTPYRGEDAGLVDFSPFPPFFKQEFIALVIAPDQYSGRSHFAHLYTDTYLAFSKLDYPNCDAIED